ncbi:EAL domain-containing protein [Shimia sp. R11_0]|uniref:putative bifunctional diguanylate cyclase/phosphodiesterase n=1 Tax=Shimia sp. R11_0 TaxID=2821096 RepID=UPI001ADADFCB|nr:EAL domain-containing protein [Shimia sp. R11_0]MBO9479594.1 EAL domain-containing protein [Shimia sp. R11_0]
MPEFLGHTAKNNMRLSFALTLLAAFVTALAYFLIAWAADKAISQRERLQLIEMTNGFTTVFSDVRGEDTLVPAEFRRIGIDHFNSTGSQQRNADQAHMSLPGLPGFELGVKADDPRLRRIIQSFADDYASDDLHENRFEAGRMIGRTMVPSIATQENCVSCHNDALGQEVFELGDVMGAYIIERDLTPELKEDIQYACILFVTSFLVFWLIIYREKNHSLNTMQLEARVQYQKMKNKAEQQEKFLLSHDPLTGLPNRKLFNDYLQQAFAVEGMPCLAAALIDLDDFKAVNDTMGHPAGDALLTEVARRLKASLTERNGFAARLGGDEFAIIWEVQESTDTGDVFAQNLLNRVSKTMQFENWQIVPKCSIGVATTMEVGAGTPQNLVKAADAALYVAKERGKNTYQRYDKTLDAQVTRQNRIVASLPSAIQNGEIGVVFQPKVQLNDGSFKGFEALARWQLGNESIAPSEFVPLAESSGVVHDLDMFVLRQATKFAADLASEMGQDIPVSINLSANSFRNGSLTEDILDVLWETGLSPEMLTLEITETAAIESWTLVQDVLLKLQGIGVRMSLDDFGTGYSSLAYLLEMQFDEIKIDREFVKNLEEGNANHKLLQHIASMSESLGISLVIEGIETAAQVKLLVGCSSRIGQGYFYSKPLAPRDAEAYLTAFSARSMSGS